ncbi:iron-sulfur cluster assembly scaffold protein [Denitrobacterium detoxificans]|jgi:NifU-like protein involved in Fe-S cluster formation|uniref:iron-sulfur cluster assembly scaffold protein n=1 Tax=Denitrobacterium detoxificans TaxID=79604 RepID=UPI0026F14D9D|nr:iron-sulfur cluster assembly scaffold protein [Denitrobacterium detoxificans]MBE6466943.1 iron-sulfur cluster assembly scaffold protein [Denitrobacterium detoxificans]
MPSDEVRNIYKEIEDRHVIRTADVYQTHMENGVRGYSDKLLSVVADFTNSGIPEGCNARGMAGKSKRGEVACQIFGTINPETRTIEHAGFRSRGCIAITASASMLCQMIEGKSIEEALAISDNDIVRALDGVPSDKRDTPIFAMEACHAMIGDWLIAQGEFDELDALTPCDMGSVTCLLCEHCSLRDLRYDLLAEQAGAASVRS